MTREEIWNWREAPEQEPHADIVGYTVVANDGEIGNVDRASFEQDEAHIVVDTGGWILGRRSVIPARAIRDVNHDSKSIQIDLSKDQIKSAPEFEGDELAAYRDSATGYYGGLGMPWMGTPLR